MTSGAARDIVFQEVRPGAGFKTGDFVKEMFEGGYRRMTLSPDERPIPRPRYTTRLLRKTNELPTILGFGVWRDRSPRNKIKPRKGYYLHRIAKARYLDQWMLSSGGNVILRSMFLKPELG